MSRMVLSTVMDALAAACVAGVIKRVYAWPSESITAPCMVIGYPEQIDFDYTFDDGSDRAMFPLYYMAGKTNDRNTRDELSRIIAGATAVKTAIDGTLSDAVNSATVMNCTITTLTVEGVGYTAARFDVEIIS